MTSYFTLNEGAIARLTGPGSGAARYVAEVSKEVEVVAEANAPFLTGQLRSSVAFRQGYSASAIEAKIFADARYAAAIELGRKIHRTRSSGPARTRPQPFLGPAAQAVARKHGLRWVPRTTRITSG